MKTLYVQDSTGFLPASNEQIVSFALSIVAKAMRRGPALTNPRIVREFLMLRFAALEHEIFAVLFLNTRNRVIAVEEMFRGTIDGASVYPREVVKAALAHNAAALILAHNHPSGEVDPSQADELITRRLREALALIDVRVLDHIIVGKESCYSFAEHGLL